MTDWLAWLLEELEEEEDQGEDLDLKARVLPGRAAEETGAAAEERNDRSGAVGRGAAPPAGEAAEEKDHPAEDRAEGRAGQGENEPLPLAARQLSQARLAQAARQARADQAWQTGTAAGTGEVRPTADGGRAGLSPPDMGAIVLESALTEPELYAAVRRTRAAAEQAQGLRQAGPVVIREPVPAGGQSPAPAELDRIFQRDARRYDGGFTLF